MARTKVTSNEIAQSYAQVFNSGTTTITGSDTTFNLASLQTNDADCFELNSGNLRVKKAGVYQATWRFATGTTVTGTASRMVMTLRITGGSTFNTSSFTSMAPASAWYSATDARIYTLNDNSDIDLVFRTEGGGSILLEQAIISVVKLV